MTHREQSLREYDPFSADEIFATIPIPPAPALSPAEALKTFQAAPGFRIECIAAEPLVVDPVFFEFDADGRLWAIEYRGWMQDIEGSGEGDPICRIVVLEDDDGDGAMDSSTIFLDGLVMPRTLSFVAGGVLVAEPPNLWYCRDVDGDLRCDDKRLVGRYGQPGNPEHTDNGLMHAIDNWMYNAKSSVRHRLIAGRLVEEPTIFRGQWGIAQDDVGRLFYNYENSPLHADLLPAEFLLRNPHFKEELWRRDSAAVNVDVARAAHEVHPIRVTPGITLGGTELRPDGRLRTFTVACGPTIYRGDQFPPEYQGTAIIPEAAGHLVRMNLLTGDGAHLEARNAFDGRELVASTDERFRPVCSRTGPDGALYVCDLYRGIIEHVIFMMPYLRNQILSRGLDKPIHLGRIYRITHERGRPLGPRPRLSKATDAELVAALAHPNGWWRDTAQRLLVERGGVAAVGPLRRLAADAAAPDVGRVHALWTLDGLDGLDRDTLEAAVASDAAPVRSAALRLGERVGGGRWPGGLPPAADDVRPMVRLQRLLALGSVASGTSAGAADDRETARDAMIDILLSAPDGLFGAALVSGARNCELEMIEQLVEPKGHGRHGTWTAEHERVAGTVAMLAACVVNAGDAVRIERLLRLAADIEPTRSWATWAIVAGMARSRAAASRWPEPVLLTGRPPLVPLLASATEEPRRRQAERVLRIVTWPGDTTPRPTRPTLVPLSAEQERRRVRGEALYAATCYSCHKGEGRGQPGQAPPLADSEWVNGDPGRLIRIALHGLVGPVEVNGETWNLAMPGLGNSPVLDDERMASVLTFIRRAWGNHGTPVDPGQVAEVRRATSGRSMAWTVAELLDPSRPPPQAAVDPLAAYRPLLGAGDAERGRRLFHANRDVRCNACHKIGMLGGGFAGPELSTVGARHGREHLLESLIEPSAKIAAGYETVVVETNSGRIVSGTLVSERDGHLVLALPAGGEERVPVSEITERVRSPISSMPPMGTVFAPGQIADLVAYLETLKGQPPASVGPTSPGGGP